MVSAWIPPIERNSQIKSRFTFEFKGKSLCLVRVKKKCRVWFGLLKDFWGNLSVVLRINFNKKRVCVGVRSHWGGILLRTTFRVYNVGKLIQTSFWHLKTEKSDNWHARLTDPTISQLAFTNNLGPRKRRDKWEWKRTDHSQIAPVSALLHYFTSRIASAKPCAQEEAGYTMGVQVISENARRAMKAKCCDRLSCGPSQQRGLKAWNRIRKLNHKCAQSTQIIRRDAVIHRGDLNEACCVTKKFMNFENLVTAYRPRISFAKWEKQFQFIPSHV